MLAAIRCFPCSYFWICWKVKPTCCPSSSWLMPINVRRAFTRPPTWTSTGRGPNSPTVYDRRRYFLPRFSGISPALSNNENQLSRLHPDVEHRQCQWDLVLRQSDLGQRPGETRRVPKRPISKEMAPNWCRVCLGELRAGLNCQNWQFSGKLLPDSSVRMPFAGLENPAWAGWSHGDVPWEAKKRRAPHGPAN